MLKTALKNMVDRTRYPELDHILWDFHAKFIAPDFAFDIYERRWKYVDPNALKAEEQQLIERLTQEYGKGHFMPAM